MKRAACVKDPLINPGLGGHIQDFRGFLTSTRTGGKIGLKIAQGLILLKPFEAVLPQVASFSTVIAFPGL